jgi:hypothetical protein
MSFFEKAIENRNYLGAAVSFMGVVGFFFSFFFSWQPLISWGPELIPTSIVFSG